MKKEPSTKFGLILFKNTDNIGDDIQSYAQSQFLPHIDYFIDREEIGTFISDQKEKVNCIMNSWWLSKRSNWPPSPYINPLPVSMHLRNTEEQGPTYLQGLGMDWFKQHEPIGLRDDLVKEYFDDAKVANYFSGCMTLTIKKQKNLKTKNYICVNDLDQALVQKIKENTNLEVKEMCHDISPIENSQLTWEERKKKVEEHLSTYQQATCVITSRLHCTLPCLAIEVPVLLIYDDDNQDVVNRMKLYSALCNHITKKESNTNFNKIKEYIDNPLKNPEEYKTYRKTLSNKCINFIKNAKYEVVSDKEYQTYEKKKVKDLKEQAENLYFDVEELQYQKNYYQKKAYELEELKRKNEILEKTLAALYQTKRYRYAEKLRKLLGMNRKARKQQ